MTQNFWQSCRCRKKRTPLQQSYDGFLALEDTIVIAARTFDMVYDKDGKKVMWDILADTEQITSDSDPMNYPNPNDDVVTKKNNNLDDLNQLSDIFFEHFFHSVEGHAKLIDKFHSNVKSP